MGGRFRHSAGAGRLYGALPTVIPKICGAMNDGLFYFGTTLASPRGRFLLNDASNEPVNKGSVSRSIKSV